MKNLALVLLVFLVLAVTAIALARVCQILAPRVGWPLLVVLAGGGLGLVALFLWQQQLFCSWPLFVVITTLTGMLLAAAGHYYDWRDAVSAVKERQAAAMAKEPRFAALIEEQISAPTWTEFMTPTTDAAATWIKWIFDAGAKLSVALAVLIVGKRYALLAGRSPGGNDA